MRTSRVNTDDQYRLIMECRRSGLSDQQWCMNHDNKPGTFYNWVKRLRQKGCQDIPEATGKAVSKSVHQQVVKIERNQTEVTPLADSPSPQMPVSMELSMGNVKLKILNGMIPGVVHFIYFVVNVVIESECIQISDISVEISSK